MILCDEAIHVLGTGHNLIKAAETDATKDFPAMKETGVKLNTVRQFFWIRMLFSSNTINSNPRLPSVLKGLYFAAADKGSLFCWCTFPALHNYNSASVSLV